MRHGLAYSRSCRRKPAQPDSTVALLLLTFAVAALSLACDPQSSSETVWVEDLSEEGLSVSRFYAVRITLFRYGPEVGGYAEFFGIDGACNTREEPYFCSDYCAYFGPGAYRNGSFRIQTTAPDGSLFQAQATMDGRRDLDLVITTGGEVLGEVPGDASPLRLAMEPDPLQVVARSCPTQDASSFRLPESD